MEGKEEEKRKQLVSVSNDMTKAVIPSTTGSFEVKSAAEVKHGTVHFCTDFSRLQLQTNTNLNIPPSNWLRSSSKLEQHVKNLTWRSAASLSHFLSIDMAHNSPDLAGEVDVISHALNIKKLLKIPFEKSHISMMVHRVGRTLILDEFDIHKHLLRTEQVEWAWLRQFYYEYVQQDLHTRMKCVPRQSKRRNSLQRRNMYSKFLYHSMFDQADEGMTADVSETGEGLHMLSTDDKTVIPPDPLPQPMGTQCHREVLWTFEDIKMLIGTDLPVFCDGNSYYVSLKLKDMRTPINVLTGLDYWLDNLMCNVPEVAMCFHIDGIVQKYEVVKTEDIPKLEDSKFDPQVVTDIAKNILAFLKNNATKEGHTYWLYKGTDEDVVKLYDLTAFCDDTDGAAEENPFTVPVGMLLYRVARNMRLNQGHQKASLIRTLLENCIYLLDERKHSQVCTSASYLLSDIYVPDSSLYDDWALCSDSSDEEITQESEDAEDQKVTSVDVDTLSDRGSVSQSREIVRVKPFTESNEERCRAAVTCIYKGLLCLERDINSVDRRSSNSHEGLSKSKSAEMYEEQACCNPNKAIPLHYTPLEKPSNTTSRSSLSSEFKGQTEVKHYEGSNLKMESCLQMACMGLDQSASSKPWHNLSRGLLFRKAAITFTALLKSRMNARDYKNALKYLRLALYCFYGLKTVLPHKEQDNSQLLGTLYGVAGDIKVIYTKSCEKVESWLSHVKDLTFEESTIIELAEKEFQCCEYDWLVHLSKEAEENLGESVECYRKALSLIGGNKTELYLSLCKRKGNALNELGVWYMQKAQFILQNEEIQERPSEVMENLWLSSKNTLMEGIETFKILEDVANQILLHCNIGRLMRLCAQTCTHISQNKDCPEFSMMERHYFKLAIDQYLEALRLGKCNEMRIRESVMWELSTTYFTMASLLQDFAPLSVMKKEEVEKEITDLMSKSLKFCKQEMSSASQPMCQYREATINHRLASLYHSSIIAECPETKKKRLRQIAEKHYERAIYQYRQMECYVECLRVQLEHIAFLEQRVVALPASRSLLKPLLQILQGLTACRDTVKGFMSQLQDKEQSSSLQEEGEKFVSILIARIQFLLLQLVKTYKILHNKKSPDRSSLIEDLKRLYTKSLSWNKCEETLVKQCAFLVDLLTEITFVYQHRVQLMEND